MAVALTTPLAEVSDWGRSGCPTSEQSPEAIELLKGEHGRAGGVAARVALDTWDFH